MKTGRTFVPAPRRRGLSLRAALKPLAVWSLALGFSALSLHGSDEPAVPSPASLAALPAAPPPEVSNASARVTVDETVHASAVQPGPAGPLADLFDPSFSLGAAPQVLGRAEPVPAALVAAAAPARPAEEEPLVTAALTEPEAPVAPGDRPTMLEVIPAPVPRPFSLQAPPLAEKPRIAAPVLPRRTREAAVPAVPADERTLFEKIFGIKRESGPAMAYAVPQDDVIDGARGRRLTPTNGTTQGTAIYDISAKVLFLPNGERLEAHSGLGDRRDDPRYVHESMKGPTPPHVYDLTLREQLFHGVQAIRLNPVGGSSAIHNRVGLLAHTFMLGPNGDSNGCVSIRDYGRFLQAYMRGDIRRLVVVASMN